MDRVRQSVARVLKAYAGPVPSVGAGMSARQVNMAVRAAYADIESVRCDIEEVALAVSAGQWHGRGQEVEEELELELKSMDSELAELSGRYTLDSQPEPRSFVMVVRLVAVVFAVLLVGLPLKAVLLPLRPLHPLLRLVGMRNNFLPLDYVTKWFARLCLLVAGIRVMREGLEELDLESPTVGMFSHASNLDPFILQSVCPIAFKWIGKRSIFAIPIFGWISLAYGHIPIDRSNRDKAIASLDSAVRKIKRWQRSIAISPEGTRSATGLLKPFKKGAFHMVADTELPVTPAVMFGNYERWPPSQMFTTPGVVTVRFLPRISFPAGTSTDAMRIAVRRAMLAGLVAPPPYYLNHADRYMSGTAWGSFALCLAVLASPLAYYYLVPWAALCSLPGRLASAALAWFAP